MLLTFEVSDIPFSLTNLLSLESVSRMAMETTAKHLIFIGKHAPDPSTLVYLHMYTHITLITVMHIVSTPPIKRK